MIQCVVGLEAFVIGILDSKFKVWELDLGLWLVYFRTLNVGINEGLGFAVWDFWAVEEGISQCYKSEISWREVFWIFNIRGSFWDLFSVDPHSHTSSCV